MAKVFAIVWSFVKRYMVAAGIISCLVAQFVMNDLDYVVTEVLVENSTIILKGENDFTKWMVEEHERRQVKLVKSKAEIIPTWMAKYFTWHQEQRERLVLRNNTENQDIKFFVVRCLEGEVCGGLSDRLKPMPFYLMVANLTNRVLLLHWKKPCELEHFMVPPPNGLDWRVEGTGVTIDDIRNNSNFVNGHADSLSLEVRKWMGIISGGEKYAQAKVLNILLDGGQRIFEANDLFNRWRKEPGQRGRNGAYLGWNTNFTINGYDLFEDVFRILFEPSPNLYKAIYDQMSQLDIVRGEFNAAQVRAHDPRQIPDDVAIEWAQQRYTGNETLNLNAYQVKLQKEKLDMLGNIVIGDKMKSYFLKLYSNAIACADKLAPGLPIYLASDSNFGISMQNISKFLVRVASLSKDAGPLHIDSNSNQGRDPSDFYQAFVDIFIMAKAKCLSIGSTGFGLFSIKISGNTCELTHLTTVCLDNHSQDKNKR